MLKLLWPVVACCGYFIGIFFWAQSVAANAANLRASVNAADTILFLIQSTAISLRAAMVGNSPEWVAFNLDSAEEDVKLLTQLSEALAYGDTKLGMTSVLTNSQKAYDMLLVNGCIDSSLPASECAHYGTQPCVYWYNLTYCLNPQLDSGASSHPVFFYGLVGTGLLPATREYEMMVEDAIAAQRAALAASVAAGTPLPRGMSFDSPPGLYIDRLGAAYLPAGIHKLANTLSEEGVAVLQAYSYSLTIVTVMSCVSLLLLYLAVYRPIIARLDSDIKRTRFLLLLVPEDVLRRVPEVGAAGKRLLGT